MEKQIIFSSIFRICIAISTNIQLTITKNIIWLLSKILIFVDFMGRHTIIFGAKDLKYGRYDFWRPTTGQIRKAKSKPQA